MSTKQRITATDGSEFKFSSEPDLDGFCAGEQEKWSWLNDTRVSRLLPQKIVDAILEPIQATRDAIADGKTLDQCLPKLQPYFSLELSVHPHSRFRSALNDALIASEMTAMYMLWFAYAEAALDVDLMVIQPANGLLPEYISGVARATSVSVGDRLPADLEKTRAAISTSLDAARADESAIQSLRNDIDEQAKNLREWTKLHMVKEAETQMELKRSHEAFSEAMRQDAERQSNEHREKWERLSETYSKQLGLQAPADYWADKKKKHKRAMWLIAAWGLGFVVIGAALLLVVAHVVFNLDAVNKIPTWYQAISFSLATVMYILGVRFTLKLLTSQVHLMLDAGERHVMIVSYLALSKDSTLEKSSLDLILAAIFRPTGDGLLKEESGPGSVTTELFSAIRGRNS